MHTTYLGPLYLLLNVSKTPDLHPDARKGSPFFFLLFFLASYRRTGRPSGKRNSFTSNIPGLSVPTRGPEMWRIVRARFRVEWTCAGLLVL